MIRWFLNRQMNAFEREFDYDMSYARDILAAGLGAFWSFSRIFGMAQYRRTFLATPGTPQKSRRLFPRTVGRARSSSSPWPSAMA